MFLTCSSQVYFQWYKVWPPSDTRPRRGLTKRVSNLQSHSDSSCSVVWTLSVHFGCPKLYQLRCIQNEIYTNWAIYQLSCIPTKLFTNGSMYHLSCILRRLSTARVCWCSLTSPRCRKWLPIRRLYQLRYSLPQLYTCTNWAIYQLSNLLNELSSTEPFTVWAIYHRATYEPSYIPTKLFIRLGPRLSGEDPRSKTKIILLVNLPALEFMRAEMSLQWSFVIRQRLAYDPWSNHVNENILKELNCGSRSKNVDR